MLTKRRKVDAECQAFNEEWENKYFLIDHFGRTTCLICNVSVSVNKEFSTQSVIMTQSRLIFQVYGSNKERQT